MAQKPDPSLSTIKHKKTPLLGIFGIILLSLGILSAEGWILGKRSIIPLIPMIFATYPFIRKEIKEVKKLSRKDILFLILLVTAFSLLFFIHSVTLNHLETQLSMIKHFWIFLFPFSSTAIVARVIFSAPISLVFSVFISLLFFVISNLNPWIVLYILFGNIVAEATVANCKKRSSLITGGVASGVSNAAVLIIYTLSTLKYNLSYLSGAALSGLVSGFMGGILSVGLIPLSELTFGYTTNLTLLELGTLDHPLLKELALRAPGTYYHSMLVATLSEMAAEAIGANPLLAKVGAYFHDIGKLKKPEYFVENQSLVNKHAKLSPHMSALILKSHVKDGVELAKKHKLGKDIIDIIQQHHGTSLIAFFYKKALDMGEEIDEREFRYPGPKPKSKEAAIIMMADSIEAASRTLTDPSPGRIKGLVFNIINNLFKDGQLEECELTFRELTTVGSVFVRVLTGIHHKRVSYPNIEEVKREKNESGSNRTGSKITPFPGIPKHLGEPDKTKGLRKKGKS